MRKLLIFTFFVLNFIAAFAVDLVAHIYDAELPVLINKKDNILCETIGILYEGSTAQMVFQRIKLSDLLKE